MGTPINAFLSSLFRPTPKKRAINTRLFFGWGIFCTSVLLLSYYCTTSVLNTVQYQASDVVDCGGERRLEAKIFKMKGF